VSDRTPPDFTGDLDGYRAWRREHPQPFNPHWCAEHWAPCPVEGKPGILASVILAGEAFAFVPEGVRTPDALNSWFANQAEPTCCKLGDRKVAFLWDLVDRVVAGNLCLNADDVPPGRHACFFEPGHEGPHEHQLPPASVFDRMPSS
jgi:hypothetical protein